MSVVEKKILKGINLSKYKFKKPPLVLGGLALEYYGIRKSGHDYDYMVSQNDWKELKKLHPKKINLFGGKTEDDIDATINLNDVHVDLIKTLFMYNYSYLSKGSINFGDYKIISLEKLLMLKTLGAVMNRHKKSINDQNKIIKYIVKTNYKK